MRRLFFLPPLGGLVAMLGCAKADRGAPAEPATRAIVRTGAERPPPPAPRVTAPRPSGAAPSSSRAQPAHDTASLAVLKQAIESKDYATRLIAIEAIAGSRADSLMPWLEHALGDPEHDVRMAVVDALERFHTARALSLLVSVRDDTTEDLDIRALAASALLEPLSTTANPDPRDRR